MKKEINDLKNVVNKQNNEIVELKSQLKICLGKIDKFNNELLILGNIKKEKNKLFSSNIIYF